MPDYRLYTIGKLGHFESSSEIAAENDGAAIAVVTKANLAVRKELWCGSRLVCEWLVADADRTDKSL